MKKIKFILVALAAIIVTLGSTSVYAQEDGNRDANGYVVKGPYLTNGGGSNWFVGVGGGFNTAVGVEIKPFAEFTPKNNWAAEAFIGKWFTPTVGVRLGYKGVMNNFAYDVNAYRSSIYASGEQVRVHYAHADFMWNISNALSGYKETRFWDIIPYFGAGYLGIENGSVDNKLGLSAGFYNEFRLGDVVNLYLDLGVTGTENPVGLRSTVDGRSPITSQTIVFARPLYLPSATIGITINLSKKKNFDRYSSVAPVALPFTLDEYNALNQRVGALEKENSDLKSKLIDCQGQKPDTILVVGPTRVLVGSTVITFAIGSDKLTKTEEEKVKMFAESFASSDTLVKIVGSADSETGSQKRNVELSENRAKVVKDVLVKNGISDERIAVSSTLNATGNPETSRSAIITLTVE